MVGNEDSLHNIRYQIYDKRKKAANALNNALEDG
jgi:hypothetical protein